MHKLSNFKQIYETPRILNNHGALFCTENSRLKRQETKRQPIDNQTTTAYLHRTEEEEETESIRVSDAGPNHLPSLPLSLSKSVGISLAWAVFKGQGLVQNIKETAICIIRNEMNKIKETIEKWSNNIKTT